MNGRVVFIDFLRGWAGIVMIEVHVFNAFIVPELKESWWYGLLNFVNGLVAPAFLFVAGLVFVIASERKLEQFRSFGGAFWRQLSRIGLIWLTGYFLHLPVFSLKRIVEVPESGWLTFYQSDILHCIAAGLLLVFVLRIVIRNEFRYAMTIFVLGLFFILAAPAAWASSVVREAHPAIRAYFQGDGSLFPLFPWLGFILWGGVVGVMYRRLSLEGSDEKFARVITAVGLILVLVEIPWIVGIPWRLTGDLRTDPLFFGLRFGLILLLLIGCRLWVKARKTDKSIVLEAGKESLLVYVGHLMILYGTFLGGRSLVDWYGGTFSTAACLAATGGLTAVMTGLAVSWGWLKKRSRPLARVVMAGGSLIVVVVFLIQ